MIKRNKKLILLTAAVLSIVTISVSIPQNAYAASEYSNVTDLSNQHEYFNAKDEYGVKWSYYKNDDGTITADGISEPEDTIVVPSQLDGYKVSKFRGLFYRIGFPVQRSKIKKVIISEGIKEVESQALMGYPNLTEIELPSTINVISQSSFSKSWLDDNRDENGYVIKNDILIDGTKAKGDIIIPDNIRVIADRAFSENNDITSVTIPSSTKRIGEDAFFRCQNLISVVLNEGLEVIGKSAFQECSNLEEANIPSSVQEAYEYIFEKCPKIKTTTDANSDNLVIADGILVDGKSASGDIVIPEGVTKIGSAAFSDNKNIKSVKLPSTLVEIGFRAFSNSSIESINIPGSVKSTGLDTFWSCTNLKNVSIENGVEKIGSESFALCTSLKDVELPDSVMKIEWSAFRACSSLTNVKYNENADVNEEAFLNTPLDKN